MYVARGIVVCNVFAVLSITLYLAPLCTRKQHTHGGNTGGNTLQYFSR